MNIDYIKGRNTVIEALRADRDIKEVIFARNVKPGNNILEIKNLAKNKGIPCNYLDQRNLSLKAGENHQGVIAAIEGYNYLSQEEFFQIITPAKSQIVLILDSIQDPRNLGSIIRTAECAGVSGVIIPERRAVGVNVTVEKASAGALSYIPVIRAGNLNNTILRLKEVGFWIFGLAPGGKDDYTGVDLRGPVCIVLGNEGKGLRHSIEKNCDFLLAIPVSGRIASLNVSVACGIILYEILRQKKSK